MKFVFKAAAAAATMALMSMSAQAQTCVPFAVSNEVGLSVQNCLGYYEGNVLNNSPGTDFVETNINSAYGLLFGVSVPLGSVTPQPAARIISPLNGAATASFAGIVESGFTVIGIHWGGGAGGGQTAIYGVQINSATWDGSYNFLADNPGGSSNIWLYSTGGGVVPGIPEPETYALMLAGLAAVGFMARRRKAKA